MSKLFLFLFSCGLSCTLMGQESPEIKSILIRIAETLPEETDLSEISGRLYYYKDHPIDLNDAQPEQLKELVFLNRLQIDNFFAHVLVAGRLANLLELQSIDGFDIETVSLLLPFVTLKTPSPINDLNLKSIRSKSEQELILRYGQILEKQKGFRKLPGSRYLGSPSKLLLRYHYRLENMIALSFVAEKDAGETFFSGVNKSGFDFMSGSLALYKMKNFSKIIIGDYSLQFGEGLALWMGTALGRGADVAGVAKNGTGFKPYTSANESSFFRGVGIKYNLLKSIDLTSFISYKNLDASLTKQSNGEYTLNTINDSGLHRTSTEIGHKHNVSQLLYGAQAEYKNGSFNIGALGYSTSYNYKFTRGKQFYKAYGFEGKKLINTGLHYNFTFRNTYLFGEAAYSFPGSSAWLNGIMASLSPFVSAVIVYKNYNKAHVSFYSQPLGQGSGAVNEKGIYGGLHLTPSRKWSISFYSDFARFPWLRYRVDQASSGLQLVGQISYTPRKNTVALVKVSARKGEQNDTSGLPVNTVVAFKKDNLRLSLQWQLNAETGMENRLEISQYRKGKGAAEQGILMYQDVDYRPVSSRLAVGFRIAYFKTPSYDSRIYAYEDDVLNGSGSGLYNGQGFRFYINSNYRLSRQCRIWVKYGIYNYPGATEIGSGLDEIMGSSKSEIRIQLRYKF